MKQALSRFFTNDKTFAVCVFAGVIGFVLYSAVEMVYFPLDNLSSIQRIFRAVCLLLTYISYQKHEKNVMKGLIGALLATQVFFSIPERLSWLSARTVFKVLFFALSLALFVNHFLINRNRFSKPVHILFNQLFAILLAVDTAVWTVYGLPDSISILNGASEIMSLIGNIGFYFSIICVETRLDLYRQNREEAGWTEEKGYPKDYIHEFDKPKTNQFH